MVQRAVTPGAGHPWLEWGMDSVQPGSQVRDAAGQMMFTGSRVRRAQGKNAGMGRVTELVSATIVRVQWDGVVDRMEAPVAIAMAAQDLVVVP